MPHDKQLDQRIKKIVAPWKGTSSKKMFGAVCHLINGNMFSGVHKDALILRLGQDKAKEARQRSHVRPFDITGKPMKGWVMVAGDGCQDDQTLKAWLQLARDFAVTLPEK